MGKQICFSKKNKCSSYRMQQFQRGHLVLSLQETWQATSRMAGKAYNGQSNICLAGELFYFKFSTLRHNQRLFDLMGQNRKGSKKGSSVILLGFELGQFQELAILRINKWNLLETIFKLKTWWYTWWSDININIW